MIIKIFTTMVRIRVEIDATVSPTKTRMIITYIALIAALQAYSVINLEGPVFLNFASSDRVIKLRIPKTMEKIPSQTMNPGCEIATAFKKYVIADMKLEAALANSEK